MARNGDIETSFTYEVISFLPIAPSIFQILIQPFDSTRLNYQAGQYLKICYPDQTFLPFSIANAPREDGIIELQIRLQKDDLETQNLLETIKKEKSLKFLGPFGDCIYTGNKKTCLLIAGGTGIAQSKALMESMFEHARPPKGIHLYWGVRNPEDFYLFEQLKVWKKQFSFFDYKLLVSNKNFTVSSDYSIGYTLQSVIADYKNLTDFQAYVSGPFPMVLEAHRMLLIQGLPKTSFHSDMLG